MILKASQRAGGLQLARHLMNHVDNDHIDLHEVRGFVSKTLRGAFTEAYAVSRGTRCKQFLFSVSLSPPETESVPIEIFERAVDDIEEKMGLVGQPRAIVFHEKEGRRHAHAVWSRIDVAEMKAINLPHFKLKLRDLSRQLYLENGWKMPRGLMNSEERNPLNFTLAEWQQAWRSKVDPRQIKEVLQDCWAVSDSRSAFASALSERGFYLAQGDRSGHVVIDWRGDVYAISRWVGIKAKDVRAKLGEADDLSSVDEVKTRLAQHFSDKLNAFADDVSRRHDKASLTLRERKRKLIVRQRGKREQFRQDQAQRKTKEAHQRSERLPKGLKALWYRVNGRWRQIVRQNEADFLACEERDRIERQDLINAQLAERRQLQREIRLLEQQQALTREQLDRDVAAYLTLSPDEQDRALSAEQEARTDRGRQRQRRPER